MKTRTLIAATLASIFLLAPIALALDEAVERTGIYESKGAILYRYETASLAALGADTARVEFKLDDFHYLDLGSAPSWRVILGVRLAAVNADSIEADSVHVEMWHGFSEDTRHTYRSCVLDSTVIYPGTPKAFDLTLYPLTVLRECTFYFTSADSDAAVFDIDLIFEKGR